MDVKKNRKKYNTFNYIIFIKLRILQDEGYRAGDHYFRNKLVTRYITPTMIGNNSEYMVLYL